jgi:hypothetical protein
LENTPKHFFISYNKADRQWAEWIAWQLEQEGYTTIIQAWDFRPGLNFVQKMHQAVQRAERTIAVLSSNYLNALYTYSEWEAAFRQDPKGERSILVPVRIEECIPLGLLGLITYIDLVGLNEAAARKKLIEGVQLGRNKPATPPLFPGNISEAQRSMPRQPHFPGTYPLVWNIPYQRNSFFTGRVDVLAQLHKALATDKPAALTQPQAISGLGGIGKTQTAVEYAYRYGSEYQVVLWARAETRETLLTDFETIAGLLSLREKDDPDQNVVIAAVKSWLNFHKGWLLILDNADDLIMARDFLPSVSSGHILLTTRAQAVGEFAQQVEIEKMGVEEGTLFLLRRAKLLAPKASIGKASAVDHVQARAIVQAMDGLPLAIDQAGAYIEETRCSLSDYLDLYQRRGDVLRRRRGKLAPHHPESIAATLSLSFEKAIQANPAAADLLQLYAFLDPDMIPEELITKGAPELSAVLQDAAADSYEWNAAIEVLLGLSLVQRNPNKKKLTIHRLVQDVLKDEMDESTQRLWVERVVRAMRHIFPFPRDLATWLQDRRYLRNAQTCAVYIEQWNMAFQEATDLLHRVRTWESILETFREIPAKFSVVLWLRDVDNLSYWQIAEVLDKPVGTIKSRYSRARRLWQESLNQSGIKIRLYNQ